MDGLQEYCGLQRENRGSARRQGLPGKARRSAVRPHETCPRTIQIELFEFPKKNPFLRVKWPFRPTVVVAYNCVAYNCRSPITVFFPVPVPPPYVLCVIKVAYNCVSYNCKIAYNCILFVPLTQKISYNCIFLMKLVLKVNFSWSVCGCHFENRFLTPKRCHSPTSGVKSR